LSLRNADPKKTCVSRECISQKGGLCLEKRMGDWEKKKGCPRRRSGRHTNPCKRGENANNLPVSGGGEKKIRGGHDQGKTPPDGIINEREKKKRRSSLCCLRRLKRKKRNVKNYSRRRKEEIIMAKGI